MSSRKRFRFPWLFLLVVVVPTALSTVYYGSMASDVYTSESRFVIRGAQRQKVTGLDSILQGAGFSQSQEDAYVVLDYMMSRDALRHLDKKYKLKDAFEDESIDVLSRFAGIDGDTSFEAFHEYYNNRIKLGLDVVSSISALSVSAFSPEDAYDVNEELLQMAEKLINELNERGRSEVLAMTKIDLDEAESAAKKARLAVSSYRNKIASVDPAKQSMFQLQVQMQQVSKLQDALLESKTKLLQLKELAPDNPQIRALRTRIKELKDEINKESAKVDEGGNRELVGKVSEYDYLLLEQEFANEQLAAAIAAYKQAQDEQRRTQLYLERIVQPNIPDAALKPERLKAILAALVLGLISWGILSMLIAGIREHKS